MHRSLLLQASIVGFLVGISPSISAVGAAETGTAPDAAAKDKEEKGWISLFDGKTFEGWTPNENKTTWKIENGELVTHGERCHLFYTGKVQDHRFKNFELKLEILTKPQSNSGVYVHTKYQDSDWPAYGVETQVNNTHGDPRKTASFYAIQDVMDKSPAKDNEWFTMDITVKDMHAVVKINDKVVNDYKQPKNPPNEPGKEKNHLSAEGGTIALQGHDPGSEVHYRNIRIKPLP